ncbi:hypothetical protein ACFL4T_00585 [candidate division KSB1 bacterium]
MELSLRGVLIPVYRDKNDVAISLFEIINRRGAEAQRIFVGERVPIPPVCIIIPSAESSLYFVAYGLLRQFLRFTQDKPRNDKRKCHCERSESISWH